MKPEREGKEAKYMDRERRSGGIGVCISAVVPITWDDMRIVLLFWLQDLQYSCSFKDPHQVISNILDTAT
jgi:hypothetical protein